MNQTKSLSKDSSQLTKNLGFPVITKRTGYFLKNDITVIKQALPYSSFTEPDAHDHVMSRRERLAADPVKAAALRKARRKIAKALNPRSNSALARLRLNAGLSQVELARRIGTQQPAVARLEKELTDPGLSTIVKLAKALGVTPEVVMAAFLQARTTSIAE